MVMPGGFESIGEDQPIERCTVPNPQEDIHTPVDGVLEPERARERLRGIRCFILDMDGTIYLGNQLFPFTPGFLKRVEETGREYYYFTNNSSKNAGEYLRKLAGMGIPAPKGRMLISNQVMIDYLLEHHRGESVYLVGTPYLREDFEQAGIPLGGEDAQLVVLGFDTTLCYEKLRIACDLVRAGKPIYGVNPDLNCPVEGGGFIPDCGSMARLIEASTGVLPEFFGKPSPHTLRHILKRTGFQPQELAVVGDRLYTDIAVAQGTPVTSILVFSGETHPEDLKGSPVQPDLVFPSLREAAQLL